MREAATRRCSAKKVPLEILENSQKNICAKVTFLIKLQAKACNFFEKDTLAKMFKNSFLTASVVT